MTGTKCAAIKRLISIMRLEIKQNSSTGSRLQILLNGMGVLSLSKINSDAYG